MFSGVGLFHGGVMFGLMVRDTLYLRVDETTREQFERAGSGHSATGVASGRSVCPPITWCLRTCWIRQDELLQWVRDAVSRRSVRGGGSTSCSFECSTCHVSFRCSPVSKKAERG